MCECKKIRNRGFTLVEIIVAATIFSFVALGLGSVFMSGMKLWGRAQKLNVSKNDLLLTFEILSKQLRQCLNTNRIDFSGSANEISFPAAVNDAIAKYTYKFKSEDKAIFRSTFQLKDILEEKAESDAAEIKVSQGIENFEVSYFYYDTENALYKWVDAWPKEYGIPCAVKFKAQGADWIVEKTVFIPIALIIQDVSS